MWNAWVVFVFSLLCLVYTYALYPLLVFVFASWSKRRFVSGAVSGDTVPFVSVVMAVHNGEAYLAQKIKQLKETDYPSHRLEIIIVDDGSTDQTAALVKEVDGLHLVQLAQQQGKPTALNAGVAIAQGELIVFCDVRQEIAVDAIGRLVSAFADERVGVVSGALQLPADKGPGLYWKYERMIRTAEGRMGLGVGATGALYAIRQRLYRPVPESCLLDDVYTPMQIALQGYRILFAEDAQVFDIEADVSHEFSRKVRTLSGNFQLLGMLPRLLHPFGHPMFVPFVSHKLLRLVCPYAMMTLLLSNLYLLLHLTGSLLFLLATIFFAQCCCYILALLAFWFGVGGAPGRLCKMFVVLHIAAVVAAKKALFRQWSWQ